MIFSFFHRRNLLGTVFRRKFHTTNATKIMQLLFLILLVYSSLLVHSKYVFFEGRVSVFDAPTVCADQGMRLAIIKSQADLDAANAVVPPTPFPEGFEDGAWIGLTRRAKSSRFKWRDGTLYRRREFDGWDGGEPNDFQDLEDCVHTRYDEGRNGRWNDLICSGIQRGVLCEFDQFCSPRNKLTRKDCEERIATCAKRGIVMKYGGGGCVGPKKKRSRGKPHEIRGWRMSM